MDNIKVCNNLEDFENLIEEAAHIDIFYNGRKLKMTEDFDDIFDNKILVRYFFTKGRLDLWIGDYSGKR